MRELTERSAGGEAAVPRDVLYVLVCGDAPLVGGVAVDLTFCERGVAIGRGAELMHVARTSGGEGERLLLPDRRASERHAAVMRTAQGWSLVDLGSTNGTFVGGARLPPNEALPLSSGQTFTVGRTALRFDREVRDAVLGRPRRHGDRDALTTLAPDTAQAFAALVRLGPANLPVIVEGETGSGKEVAARALHELSHRPGPFVAVNCAALPEALAESELFGHKRGAFSGATEERTGLVASAHRGTLLLDEVVDLPVSLQAKLLRVLQEREVLPLGATRPVPVDVRVVAAAQTDLMPLVATKRFRADLLARLRGAVVRLPPLRARRCDLGLLIAAMLRRHARDPEAWRFDRRSVEALLAAPFPGNVRELERLVEAVIAFMPEGGEVTTDLLARTPFAAPPEPPANAPAPPSARVLHAAADEAVQARLLDQLAQHQGNVSAVARAMNRTRAQVHRWLARWRIDPNRYRPPS